jgi:hypothetical protein
MRRGGSELLSDAVIFHPTQWQLFPPEMEEELKQFVWRYGISHSISSYVDYKPVELEYTIFSFCKRQ